MNAWVDDYLRDLGPGDADITSHDTYVRGVPHATFARLRREDPVSWWDEADGSGFWAVTRYDDALHVSRNHETFTSTRGIRLEEMDDEELASRRTMMEIDPPEHSRLRRLVSRGFTRRVVWTYEEGIRQIAGEVLDAAIPKGEFDFVHDVAQQLPMRMLGRLLGTPDEDGDQLVHWGDALLGNTDPEFTEHVVDLADTEEFRLLPFRSPAALEIFRYAEARAAERRACPGDDVISQLLAPTVDGEPLTDLEFKNFFALLVAAGNDTTRYSITHGVWTMLEHPTLWDRWRAHPELTDTAIEEILRTSAVTMHFRRTATRNVELGGRAIAEGDKVVMWFNSANHDEDAFPDPFRFDLGRSPNQHMSFGWNGPHLCLGAWLARMELKVLFEELFRRVDRLEANGPRENLRSNFIAGIKRLPVRAIPIGSSVTG
jgi:hypothetical protein